VSASDPQKGIFKLTRQHSSISAKLFVLVNIIKLTFGIEMGGC